MSQQIEIGQYLVVDPEVGSGELIFKGIYIPVRTVLDDLLQGGSVDSLLVRHPELSRAAVSEALELATRAFLSPFEPTQPPERPFLPDGQVQIKEATQCKSKTLVSCHPELR
jgi:uncharacterized protein (DUF433 family)